MYTWSEEPLAQKGKGNLCLLEKGGRDFFLILAPTNFFLDLRFKNLKSAMCVF